MTPYPFKFSTISEQKDESASNSPADKKTGDKNEDIAVQATPDETLQQVVVTKSQEKASGSEGIIEIACSKVSKN